MVGLEPAWRERYQCLSGGQRQRIGIARALALNRAADRGRRGHLGAGRVAALADARPVAGTADRLGLSFIFISHDIAVIRYFCDRVAVMYRGRWSRPAPPNQVCDAPQHAYTQALLSAIPRPDPRTRGMHQALPLPAPDGLKARRMKITDIKTFPDARERARCPPGPRTTPSARTGYRPASRARANWLFVKVYTDEGWWASANARAGARDRDRRAGPAAS